MQLTVKFRHWIDLMFGLRLALVMFGGGWLAAEIEGGVVGFVVAIAIGYGIGWVLDEAVFMLLVAKPARVQRFYQEAQEEKRKEWREEERKQREKEERERKK